jgi:hypothetical protein
VPQLCHNFADGIPVVAVKVSWGAAKFKEVSQNRGWGGTAPERFGYMNADEAAIVIKSLGGRVGMRAEIFWRCGRAGGGRAAACPYASITLIETSRSLVHYRGRVGGRPARKGRMTQWRAGRDSRRACKSFQCNDQDLS